MTHLEFFKALKSGEIGRVYLFCGKEDLIRKSALEQLEGRILQPGLEDLNRTRLQDPDAQTIIESCETLPLMSDRRLVIVEDCRLLLKQEGKKGKEKTESEADDAAAERLTAYLASLPETTCLVFTTGRDIDARRKLCKALCTPERQVSFDPLSDSDLAKWMNQQLRRQGKSMSAENCARLAFTSGRDLTALKSELDKLSAYAGERTEITAEDIEAVATHTSECTVFAMVDAISAGKTADAFGFLNILLNGGESRIGILALITRHYRQLLHLRLLTDGGIPKNRVIEVMGIKPFVHGRLLSQMGRQSREILEKKVNACVDTDYGIKSGRFSDEAGLARLMLEIGTGLH